MSAQLESHLIDKEAWLKGKYVEIGLNAKGVFGSNTFKKPVTFHENREIRNFLFGFIANPTKDDWKFYDGDFFTPGTPEEGFTIEIDGANYSNNNDFRDEIKGEIQNANVVKSDCFDDIAKAEWEGTVDNVQIKRTYSVTENGLFIQMITSVTNLSSDIKRNIYFMHNLDPDNNVSLTDNYATDLEVISQPSSVNNIALVKATQPPSPGVDEDGSAISFYANDSRARVTYGGFDNRNASSIWTNKFNEFTDETGKKINEDFAMSIAFNLGNLQPNESKSFVYFYILEEVDESFIPLIVNTTSTNTSTCNTNDGSIQFSGLVKNENYKISYKKNGTDIPAANYTADADGIIKFLNLDVATYNGFVLEYTACKTTLDAEIIIRTPPKPILDISKKDPTNCNGNDGEIILSNLTANENIEISYDFNGVNVPVIVKKINNKGELILNNLVNGDYSNFSLKYARTICSDSFTNTINLNGTTPLNTNPSIPEQFFCDTDLDYKTTIDLSVVDTYVLGSFSTASYNVSYHTTEINAKNNISVAKTSYLTSGLQSYDLFYRLENKTTGCFETGNFTITINIPADFEINSGTLCLLANDSIDPDYRLPMNTGLDNSLYTFEWFLDGVKLSNTQPSLVLEKQGTYKVTATTISTGCSISKEVEIFPSGKPRDFRVFFESGIFTNNQEIRVVATGLGNYEYRINDELYSSNSLFKDVPSGNNLFYINDINGCGEIVIEKMSINYPRFFTPNGDATNDLWRIEDMESLRNPIINIYNRYGKLIKVISDKFDGWNGTSNGKNLASNSYWFIVNYIDENGVSKKFQGNFSLIRKN